MRLIVVNGFLGSGKTTFIQRFLSTHSQPIAVIVNEFGKTSYDGDLLGIQSSLVTSIHHGSIFCTCKAEEFVTVLSRILFEQHVLCLIESSGFADPSGMNGLIVRAMQQASIQETEVCALSIVDPLTFKKLIGSMAMMRKQVETADTILINKSDLCDQSTLDELKSLVAVFNRNANIVHGSRGELSEDQLIFHQVVTSDPTTNGSKKDPTAGEITLTCKTWASDQSISDFLTDIQPYLLRLKGYVHTSENAYRIEIAAGICTMETIANASNELVLLYSSKFTSSQQLLEIVGKHQPEVERWLK